ncbi:MULTISPECIES: hypothetical protein [Chromobacterium]|uniref:Uncharacterized protein n=1 Tax=Chromobacterium sinusclupearum TaxID=2077146 RepID=A0A2K4MTL2_9NEIS|nr:MULTISPECIES: hypothetical protein [Chromobacterium]POB00452.1 hypothetical protein C2134_01490 [Chromobacterium sinusclupearum]
MKQSSYDAIDAAIERHANGTAKLTDGKITHVNIAKEAKVGRATVYRCFDEHAALKEKFEKLKKNGLNQTQEPPQTLHEAFLAAKKEIKQLRDNLKEEKQRSEHKEKLSANMIFILKREIQRLETENKNLRKLLPAPSIIHLPQQLG